MLTSGRIILSNTGRNRSSSREEFLIRDTKSLKKSGDQVDFPRGKFCANASV